MLKASYPIGLSAPRNYNLGEKNTQSLFGKNVFLTNCVALLLAIQFINSYTQEILSYKTLNVYLFSNTAFNTSIYISKDVEETKCAKIVGLDRIRSVTL